MNRVFDPIALLPGLIAAALVAPDGQLAGWCANSAIAPERLRMIGLSCRSMMAASRAEKREAGLGWAVFGARTLVFREGPEGLLLAYLDSVVNDAVVTWFFAQVDPLLAPEKPVIG